MQQIKFKAITTSGQWVEGDLIHLDERTMIAGIEMSAYDNGNTHEYIQIECVEVIPETVCQFIDTYKGKDFWQNDTVVHPELGNGLIKWANTGYVVEYSDGYTIDLHEDWGELEITGSIHDHLLAQKTENDENTCK